jgi:hypothetical protein
MSSDFSPIPPPRRRGLEKLRYDISVLWSSLPCRLLGHSWRAIGPRNRTCTRCGWNQWLRDHPLGGAAEWVGGS